MNWKCTVLLCCAALAGAKEIVIGPGGAGDAAIGRAVESAPDGSIIRLKRGIYREFVAISRPISLIGEPGAVIDPSEPFSAKWERAPEFGAGVYQAKVDREPASLFIDGKVLAEVKP